MSETFTKPYRSRPGLSKAAALKALQTAPFFVEGSVVTDIVPVRGVPGQWQATVEHPKVAGDLPFSDDDSDSDESTLPKKKKGEKDESDSGSDSLPVDDLDGPPEDNEESEEISLLKQILHALQGGAGPDSGMGGPDGPHGAGPDGPPPGGSGGKAPVPHPLKPGETPPGRTPINAPAFSKVQLNERVAAVSKRARTIVISRNYETPHANNEEREARFKDTVAGAREVAAANGYKLKQGRFEGDRSIKILARIDS